MDASDVRAIAADGWGLLPYALTLARPLVTARGALRQRHGFLVRLVDDDGRHGWGEAAPLPEHGGADLDTTHRALLAMLAAIGPDLAHGRLAPPATPSDLARLCRDLATEWPTAGAAVAAVDTALADLASRRLGLSLSRWLHPQSRPDVLLCAVIGAVSPQRAARQALAAARQGYRALKIKVGTDDLADLERIAAVRAAVGRRAHLRADANGTWDPLRAEVMLEALAAHDLEYVEQPVPADDVDALAQLRRQGATPVAADEALLVPGGLERILTSEAADVLVLKPSLAGGPAAAWQMAAQAADRGMATVVSSAIESAVGRIAAAHLAAALPAPERPCGLATGALLADDLVAGPTPVRGRLPLPDAPGLGLDVPLPGTDAG